MHFAIITGKELYLIIADDETAARHWAINHLDVSDDRKVIIREIELFNDVTSGISKL